MQNSKSNEWAKAATVVVKLSVALLAYQCLDIFCVFSCSPNNFRPECFLNDVRQSEGSILLV
jgi:hypothetical protein